MATYEENTLIKVYDKRGDCHIQYPKTKVSQVIGLEDKIEEIQESTKVTDTYGIAGTAGESVKPQNMFNAVGNFMKNSAITTSNFLTNFKARLKNSLDTTDEGYALDARQGKTLKTNIDNVSGDLSNLGSTVQGINNTVTTMGNTVSTIGNTITSMQNAIDAIEESSSVMQAAKITLTQTGWDSNRRQTITVQGMVSENDMAVFICPLASYSEEFVANNVLCVSQTTNTLVFQCDTVPTSNIVIYLIIKSATTEEDIENLEIILSEAYQVIQTIRTQNTTATTNISSLQAQNNTASSNISDLTSLNQTASTRIDDLTDANTEASVTLSSLESANTIASENISDLGTANNTASSNISDLTTANSTASENITDLNTENTSATSNIASLGTANTNSTNNIHTLTDLNNDAEQNISDINTANADAQDTLGSLSAMNITASQTYDNLDTANDSATAIINNLNTATTDGNTLYTNMTSANTTASGNISNLTSLNTLATTNITDLGMATQDGQDVLDELTAMNTTAGTTLGNLTTAEQTARDTITQLDLDTKLDKNGDSENVITTFTSADVESASTTAYTDPGVLTSGETHKSLFAKISQIGKNVKYLYKMLGTTDISAIGGGTATGAISSLNNSLSNTTRRDSSLVDAYTYGGTVSTTGAEILGVQFARSDNNEDKYRFQIRSTGSLEFYQHNGTNFATLFAFNLNNTMIKYANPTLTETQLLTLAPGMYMYNTAFSWLPTGCGQYGTIVSYLTNSSGYGVIQIMDTSGNVYSRHHNNTGWHHNWVTIYKVPIHCLAQVNTGGDQTYTGAIIFNHAIQNVGNCYNTSTGVFTCPVAGTYAISFGYYSNNTSANTRPAIMLNGGTISITNGPYGHDLFVTRYCAAGDKITAGAYSASYPVYMYAGGGHNHFSVTLIQAS